MRVLGKGLPSPLFLTISALVSGSLLGCADDGIKPEPPSMARQNIPPNYEVRARVAHLPLIVASATGEVSPAENQKLSGFLANLAAGNSQALHVRVTGLSTPQAKARLTRALVADGLEPSKIEFADGLVRDPRRRTYQRATDIAGANPLGDDSQNLGYAPPVKVDVAAEIYSVVPPTCPRLSRVRIIGGDNGVDSNWGCSTVSVFEQMVADPRDLVRGESGETADSEVTSGAIDRMRKDKLKPLQDTGSVTMSAAGGGS